jgi:diguanylate cyclase (GGDEF)-like protein/PAS domain S-box-containing protein
MRRRIHDVLARAGTALRGTLARAMPSLRTLKWRLTLGALLTLGLAIVLITTVLLRRAEADILAAQHHGELNEASRTASVLSRRIVRLQLTLEALGARLDTETLADRHLLARRFEATAPVLLSVFGSLVVAAPDGTVLMRLDQTGARPSDQAVGDRPYFRRTVLEGQPTTSEPLISRFSGEPIVVLTWPLKSPGGLRGVLLATLHLKNRDLVADLAEMYRDESQAMLIVTDAQGRILAHPDGRRLLRSLDDEPRFKHAYAAWVGDGRTVEPSGLTLAQHGDLITAAGVPGPDWMVWRALPEAELLAPLRDAQRHAIGWAGGLLAAVWALALLLIGLALKPLAQLEDRARRLFDSTQPGDLGWPVAQGEIGSLSAVLREVGLERQRLEAANGQSLRRLESVLAAAPVGIAFTRGPRLELVSADMCRMFGLSEAELLRQPAHVLHASLNDYKALGELVKQTFRAGLPYAGECAMRRADGSTFWAQLRGRPVDSHDAGAGTIWSIVDVSGEVAARARLEWSATHDALTGLANRPAFDLRLARLFQTLPQSLPAALLAIDLDHFKPINDSAGHAAGDEMLKAVATVISSRVRANDLVVRTGGDEFAVLLEHCTEEVAQRAAISIQEGIRHIGLPWDGRLLTVGASIGVAPLQAGLNDPEAWKRAADIACYAKKALGRNTEPERLRLVGAARYSAADAAPGTDSDAA